MSAGRRRSRGWPAINWLQAGDAGLAIESLEKAVKANDADATRALALAYVVGNRAGGRVAAARAPSRERSPTDQAALLAGVYATYATHASGAKSDALVDRSHARPGVGQSLRRERR